GDKRASTEAPDGEGSALPGENAAARMHGWGAQRGENGDGDGDGQRADSAHHEGARRDGEAVGGEGGGHLCRRQGGIVTAQQDLFAKVAKEERIDRQIRINTAAAVAKWDFSNYSWITIYR
ncbi:hypothetical protein, partial [Aeromonas caviae]|uniref:hypothetical protein n=1 Tax=Aeromonas caviae TaxID=648 RepID=UPI001C8686ED